ncbi:hypothetical protein Bca52824_040323 [Brassica carinata]|uniref:Uncharacterized protein n=1 Tax=Brassica carinata TaxID=52824 RepID=A0A8X7UWT7_BRACI|nr:hypothetical protein Bca52824_040323 [Brassica carinata]
MDCWEVTGTWVNTKPVVSPAKKKDIKTMFKDIVDAMRERFGMCLKEIKYPAGKGGRCGEEGWYHHKTERDIISKHYPST